MLILKKLKNIFYKKEAGKQDDLIKAENIKTLTPREYETFLLLKEGYSLKFSAEKMGIKYSTANTYQNAIYKKLHVRNRANLIIEYKDIENNQINN